MKKIFILLLLFLNFQCFAIDDLKDIGIAKYAVIETIKDNAPLRNQPNEDAKRIANLYNKTILYATKENDNYYKIELSENNYAWINKKYTEIQAIIPEKRLESISKITFKDKKNKQVILIDTPSKTPYQFKEDKNNIDFTLFDVFYSPTNIRQNENNNYKIKISNKIEKEFKIQYLNNTPLFGYDITPTDTGYKIEIKRSPKINKKKPLKKIKITLDAGHGGVETGVCANNLVEKDINLEITKKLKKEFKKSGATVYMTRKKDEKVDLYKRVDFAKEKNSDILLSIHQNALPNWKDIDKKYGVGTYYYQTQSKALATKIKDELVKSTGFRDDNVNYRSFVLTRPTSQLSVLIECGYLIKKDEAEKLKDKNFQKLVAKSIVKATGDYLKETY